MRRVKTRLLVILTVSCCLTGFLFHMLSITHNIYTVFVQNSNIQHYRRDIVNSVCLQNNLTNSSQEIPRVVAAQLFVEHSHKLIYCEVPKVGCSNWKRIILLLNKSIKVTADELEHNHVHTSPSLIRLSYYSPDKQAELLNNYTKVMFVRDPLQRMVSAYRDKFLHNEPYYSKTYAEIIRKRVRKNVNSTENITFKEFARFITVENPQYRDTHWKPMFQLCDPCNIQYDIIGKYETLNRDADLVLKTIRAPKGIQYPSIKHYGNESRTNNIISCDYFNSLPKNLRQKLLNIYRLDFDMFEYRPINNSSSEQLTCRYNI